MCKQLRHSMFLILLVSLLASSVASAKIVGWWKFDDGAGTTAVDSSGSGYNGTVVGTPQWVAGQLGGALKLSGSANYVNCGIIPIATNGTGAISVCCWLNRAVSGDHKVCSDRQASNNAGGGFTCAIYNDRMEMDLCDAVGRVLSRDASRPTIPGINTWVHLAWVYDDTANTLRLYVNGTLTTTATVTQSVGLSTQFFRIGCDSPTPGYYVNGTVDDLRLCDHAMTDMEIANAMKGIGPAYGQATKPRPADKATDVVRDVVLGWTAGKFQGQHDVYFGTTFADVNAASRTGPQGVLASQARDANSYDPTGLLDFGKTYYWRVDEVNKTADNTIFKGTVWSFTTEPYAYPLKTVTATASSAQPGMGPENTVNGSGMNASDQHGTEVTTMWVSNGVKPNWIQYQFDKVYKLSELWVWNANQLIESFLGFGAKDVKIEYSTDGSTWAELAGVPQFAQAPGVTTYTHDTTVNFNGVLAKYVKLTINNTWSGLPQASLSEVRFFYVPMAAREPGPVSGAANVAPQVTLTWRPGREAASHQVFLGTDPNNLPQVATVTETRYPADLNLGQTYYWRIVEAADAKDAAAWPGDVWSFSTGKFFVVEDFESYDDNNRIYDTWVDGFGSKTNGAVVGYGQSPFAETRIVQNGKQAMPLFYSNSGGPTYSEAQRIFDAQDWTKHGYKTLALSFFGDPNNTGQMYLKINGTKIPYGGKADDLKRTAWQPWNIDLATSGANLKSVTRLAIGVEGAGASGTLYFDDIRLYPIAGEMVNPVDPGKTGLTAWYKFDGDFKDSAGTYHGTPKGDAKTVADAARGQVLTLDGVGDAVAVPLLGSGTSLTISMWVNTAVDPVPIQFESFFHANGWEAGDLHWRYSYGKVNSGINGQTDLTGTSIGKVNQWNHVAVTVSPTEWALWFNGLKEASRTLTAPLTVTLGDGLIGAWLGTDGTTISRGFTGKVDDARFYNRALSAEEIAFLAGRTEPFAKPF